MTSFLALPVRPLAFSNEIVSNKDQPPNDWKLKLRYGKLKTPYKHFTVFAEGCMEEESSVFECHLDGMDFSLFESKSEYQEMIKLLSREHVDAISVSTYRYKDNAFGTDQDMAEIAREVTDLPLMICGQIYDRSSSEESLKNADIVLSGKSFLLNPRLGRRCSNRNPLL